MLELMLLLWLFFLWIAAEIWIIFLILQQQMESDFPIVYGQCPRRSNRVGTEDDPNFYRQD